MKQAIILLQLTPADLAALDQLEGMTALPAMRLKMTTLSRVYDRGCTVEFLMWPYGSWSSLNAFNLKRFAFFGSLPWLSMSRWWPFRQNQDLSCGFRSAHFALALDSLLLRRDLLAMLQDLADASQTNAFRLVNEWRKAGQP